MSHTHKACSSSLKTLETRYISSECTKEKQKEHPTTKITKDCSKWTLIQNILVCNYYGKLLKLFSLNQMKVLWQFQYHRPLLAHFKSSLLGRIPVQNSMAFSKVTQNLIFSNG